MPYYKLRVYCTVYYIVLLYVVCIIWNFLCSRFTLIFWIYMLGHEPSATVTSKRVPEPVDDEEELDGPALLEARLQQFRELQDRAFHLVDTPGARPGSLADELASGLVTHNASHHQAQFSSS